MPTLRFPQEAGVMTIDAVGPNTVVVSNTIAIPVGAFITRVTVRQRTGSSFPAGRAFCEVSLFRIQAGGGAIGLGILWRGKVMGFGVSGFPASTPNLFVGGSGWTAQAQVHFGSGAAAGDSVSVSVEVAEGPIGDTTYWIQEPTDGKGEIRSIALGDPVAGANYATQTVPAQVTWEFKGHRGTLTASAAVANRYPQVIFDDGATAFTGGIAALAHAASQSRTWSSGVGLIPDVSDPGGKTNNQFGVPKVDKLPAGFRILFTTLGLDVADNWGPGQMVIEEWAGPQ